MFKELSDEFLGKVSGGDMYHFKHKANYQCEYGSDCSLKVFSWVVCKDGQNIYSTGRSSKEGLCFCSNKASATEAQQRLNKDSKISKISNVIVDENAHNRLCDCGLCFPM